MVVETVIGKRRQKRIKMVLPVKVQWRDKANNAVNELAHTLDITPSGARLGAIRQELKTGDKVTLQYRQRKLQFRVVWVMPLAGTREYQVGLESVCNDSWGLELSDTDVADVRPQVATPPARRCAAATEASHSKNDN
jgi:PilZ domain